MVYNVKKYVEWLTKHDLLAEQDLICRLLCAEQDGYHNLPERDTLVNYYEYFSKVVKDKKLVNGEHIWTKAIMDDLVDKGFIQYSGVTDKVHWDDYEVTEKYMNIAFKKIPEKWDLFEEFWNTYPWFVTKDNKKFNLKSLNKEEVFEQYKYHLGTQALENHDLILKALKIAKSKGDVNNRVDKWLEGEFYKAYAQEVEQGLSVEETSRIQ